jgi:hypothetical protein
MDEKQCVYYTLNEPIEGHNSYKIIIKNNNILIHKLVSNNGVLGFGKKPIIVIDEFINFFLEHASDNYVMLINIDNIEYLYVGNIIYSFITKDTINSLVIFDSWVCSAGNNYTYLFEDQLYIKNNQLRQMYVDEDFREFYLRKPEYFNTLSIGNLDSLIGSRF